MAAIMIEESIQGGKTEALDFTAHAMTLQVFFETPYMDPSRFASISPLLIIGTTAYVYPAY